MKTTTILRFFVALNEDETEIIKAAKDIDDLHKSLSDGIFGYFKPTVIKPVNVKATVVNGEVKIYT